MNRYIVKSEGLTWLVFDTFRSIVVKTCEAQANAAEIAECKNEIEAFA